MAKRRRIWALVLGILGVLLVLGSFLWRSLASDALVKYPDDVDETPVYTGTVTLYVDPATAAPLPAPQEVPLEVRRHVQVTESTSELAVVHETLNLTATGLFDAVQENQYVMDRKTMLNVADDRAWAFDAANVVDRSGAYRLNFPLDNQSIPYPIYLNETQTTYQAMPDSAAADRHHRRPRRAQLQGRRAVHAGDRHLPDRPRRAHCPNRCHASSGSSSSRRSWPRRASTSRVCCPPSCRR